SCTMCSNSTACWSATDAMQSLSQSELRKLGVTMENFMLIFYQAVCRNTNRKHVEQNLHDGVNLFRRRTDGGERLAIGIQPGHDVLMVGDVLAQDGQDQIVRQHRVDGRRVSRRLVPARRLDDEWHAMVNQQLV